MNILIGDIGGTKTIMAVFSRERGPFDPLTEKSYPSQKYASLEEIIHDFLAETDLPVSGACFGVAGPVIDGRSHITNLPWTIDSASIKAAFGFDEVGLLNDLEAVAYAVPVLREEDIHTLSAGEPVAGGVLSVIAPGTGLGEGFLTYENGRYMAHPSEGSHVSFAPVGEQQIELLRYLNRRGFAHVSFERVCSGGLGIPHLYAFLKDSGYDKEPAWLAEQLAGTDDPTPVIINAARDEDVPCALAVRTLEMFIEILGAEAGNLALKVLSTGGIYIGGGIPPRILAYLQQPFFIDALRSKGRFEEMLACIPVHVILNQKAGLVGAAYFGMSYLEA